MCKGADFNLTLTLKSIIFQQQTICGGFKFLFEERKTTTKQSVHLRETIILTNLPFICLMKYCNIIKIQTIYVAIYTTFAMGPP